MQLLPAHVSEVLRQVEHANLPVGGWTGGDAWFGSVCCAVMVKKVKQVHSTWVVKNNSALSPHAVLLSVLKARYPKKPAGHWVVMKTTISDVPIYAIAYAWSQSSVSYFVTTIGDTTPAPTVEITLNMIPSNLIGDL